MENSSQTQSQTSHFSNLESEKTLLGTIIIEPDVLLEVEAIIKPADLYSDKHRLLYGLCWESYKTDGTISLPKLCELSRGKITAFEITELTELAETKQAGISLAKIIKEKAMLRQTRDMALQTIDRLKKNEDFKEILNKTQIDLIDIIKKTRDEKKAQARDIIPRIEATMKQNKEMGGIGLTMGMGFLTNAIRAYIPGHLFIIGAWCLGKGTEVICSNGRKKKVENIVVGDKLMSVYDSKPRQIKAITTGIDVLYKISGKYIKSFIVNSNHILPILDIANTKYSEQPKIKYLTAKKINSLSEGRIKTMRLLKYPTKGKEKKLKIDPYFLGYWLGDGTITKSEITIQGNKTAVIDYIKSYAEKLGLRFVAHREKRRENLFYVGIKASHGGNPQAMKNELLRKLPKTKLIPKEYFYSSLKQRLELLAGLIDSDGSLAGAGKDGFCFSQKDICLVNQVEEIAISCGFNTHIKKSIQTGSNLIPNSKGDEIYKLHITGRVYLIPTKTKKAMNVSRRNRLKLENTIGVPFKIERVGVGEYFGFELDGNHLFLVDGNIVNHNTSIGKTTMMWELIKRIFEFNSTGDPKVLVVSTEMTDQGNLLKLIGNYCGVSPLAILDQANRSPETRQRIGQAMIKAASHKLSIVDNLYKWDDIYLKCKKEKLVNGLDVVFIDFIQNMIAPGSIYERMSVLSPMMTNMAKELECTVVALSQLSNEAAAGGDLLKFKGAGEIAAACDLGIILERGKGEDGILNRDINVRIKKNRWGPTGHHLCRFNPTYTSIDVVPDKEKEETDIFEKANRR